MSWLRAQEMCSDGFGEVEQEEGRPPDLLLCQGGQHKGAVSSSAAWPQHSMGPASAVSPGSCSLQEPHHQNQPGDGWANNGQKPQGQTLG